ncbi:MAG: prepilin-type N-terminal cleavage/methylation domain-containing protein [Lachnospiraceae bacterium]|nr:prepilin-type N-terminal cleavage/methylation domain-containing protein [Lachnospiraceae bacterium]
MKRLRKVKRKLNNSGLTLIEVLIAMTLLTVAIVPMMRGFIQVGRYGEKGRNLQQATSIAQTAMENCKAYNVTDIAGKMGDSTFLNPSASYMAGAQYKSDQDNLYFIDNMTVDGRKMAMSVRLNPISATNQEITKYENCNERLDGIFVATEAKDTFDSAEYTFWELEQLCINSFFEYIAENAPSNGSIEAQVLAQKGVTVDVTAEEVEESLFKDNSSPNKGKLKLLRDILITAETDAAGYDTAKVEYTYTAVGTGDYVYTMPDGSTVNVPMTSTYTAPTIEATIYTNNSSKMDGGKLERIYFYYYPAYNNYVELPFEEDNIYIDTSAFKKDNGDGKDLDVYLIKQKLPSTTDMIIELAESDPGYKNTVEVMTRVNGSQMGKVNLYHNFNTNIGTNVTDLNTWSDLAIKEYTEVSGAGTCVDKKGLVETETKELMYTIEVKMYTNPSVEKDAVTNKYTITGDEILTLEGTKINW